MKAYKSDTLLSEIEKRHLREQIFNSVQKEKAKGKQLKTIFAVAASLVFLLGLGYYSQIESEPSLEDFVRSAPQINMQEAEGVTLLLGNDTRVDLNEENTSIQYSSSGRSVDLGSGKKVNQKSKVKEKPVYNTLIVPYGKRTTLELSDGTLVWLNSGSKLIYPAVFTGDVRPVYLEGEAIFDVAHNAKMPFRVSSKHQEIEVLGTVFNVTSYPGDQIIETVLKSGSVNITCRKGGKKVKLTPGSLSSLNTKSSEIRTKNVNVKNYFSWRSGFLTLQSNSLTEIMTKLSRYYNFEFVILNEDIGNQTFSGKLDLNDDVQQVIQVLRETTEFEFQIVDNKIMIK